MADLDVTDVLYDPDFVSLFDVTRSQKTEVKGRPQLTPLETLTELEGVVTPATSRELMRLPDMERRRGTIVVVTADFQLSTGFTQSDGTVVGADVVTFPSGGSNTYVVVMVDDLSNFGAGFVRATCQLEVLAPSS